MVGTNCSYTPVLMLVLPEDLQALSKGLCLFFGQPQPCVLVRPRSPQLAQSRGVRRQTEGVVAQAGQGVWQMLPVQDLLQHLPLPGLLHAPLPTAPAWVLGREFSPVCMNSRFGVFFASCAVLSVLHLRLDEMRLFSAFHCLALKSPLPSLHRAQ